MKNNTTTMRSLMLALAVWLGAPTVHAEDVEIYYSAEGSGNSGQILFMLDTSGSMAWCEQDNQYCSDVPNRRVNQMKTAFSNLLDTLSGDVEVGVGRFNRYQGGVGGYVVYPVRPLDDPDFDGITVTTIRDGDADGWQENNGTLHLDDEEIRFPNGGETNGVSGFLFEQVGVPRRAPVSEAWLVVEANANGNDDLTMDVQYETATSPQPFDVQDINSRSWSSPVTVAVLPDWNNGDKVRVDITPVIQQALERNDWCGGNNLALRFSSTSPSDTNNRRIETSEDDGPTPSPPELHIHWDHTASLTVTADPVTDPAGYQSQLACGAGQRQGVSNGADDALEDLSSGAVSLSDSALEIEENSKAAGLRFPVLPYDARPGLSEPDVITKATLHVRGRSQETCHPWYTWYCWGGVDSGSTTLVVKAMDGSSDGFDADQANDLSSRSLGSEEVRYTTSAADDDFARWHEIDVTDLVREALSDSDWSENSHLGLYITGEDTAVQIFGRESGAANAAYLSLQVASSELVDYVPRVRDRLKETVNGFNADDGTPLMESYSEMARYMMGLTPSYGNASTPEATGFTDSTRTDYDSPLGGLNQCETASIVMMTDGAPSVDTAYGQVTDITGVGGNDCHNNEPSQVEKSFACQAHLAGWLYDSNRNDMGIPVRTHMVGFYLDDTTLGRMEQVTNAGNGVTASANDVETLQEAFSRIVNSVTADNSTMAAPGVSVNQLNRLEFLDQLYYGVFKPSNSSPWLGNLKRYRLDYGDPDATDPAEQQTRVLDQNGNDAVDPNTGFFRDSAHSFWSADADGPDVLLGGARGELVPADRKLFVMTSNPGPDSGALATTPGALTTPVDFVDWDDVSATALGLPSGASDEDRQAVHDFLKRSWGDPLHSQPRLVNYGLVGGATAEEAFSDPSKQDNVIFVSTNDGMLHAIDASDGSEYFAFMPAETLAASAGRESAPSIGQNPITRSTYGLDASWTPWRIDSDGDNEADKVYLFGGMRRGGNNYYALDVSDRSAPKLMWSIQGGQGDYDNLAQTWSDPTRAWVRIGGNRIPVVIFGGGYSAADHDDAGNVSNGDAAGNSIYIANAYTGDLIVEISNTGADANHDDMDWSIPAGISLVDHDGDFNVDFLYAADLAGQVFRVDLDNTTSNAAGLVDRVVTVAQLGITDAGNNIADHRRFYASPVVARDMDDNYRVAVGSGYRAHPLDEQTQDRFYAFIDAGAQDAINGGFYTTSDVITPSDLLDVTNDQDPDEAALEAASGWYIDLEQGEKVLASPVVVEGTVFFTSYVPETANGSNCSAVTGTTRLYGVALESGAPAVETFNSGTLGDDGRHTETNVAGLPPQPQVLVYDKGGSDGGGGGGDDPSDPCGKDLEVSVLVGTRVVEGGQLNACGFHKTRWYEVPGEDEVNDILDNHGAVN